MIFKELEIQQIKKVVSFNLSEEEISEFNKVESNYNLIKALFFNGKKHYLQDLISKRIKYDSLFSDDIIKRNISEKNFSRIEVNRELKKIYYIYI